MEVVRQAYVEMGRKEIAETALKEGDLAPDFSLFDVKTGRVVSSAALLQEGPVILNFFRGGWCESDKLELKRYDSLVNAFEEKGSRVISVAADDMEDLKAEIEKDKLDRLTVLCDSKFQVSACFRLTYDMKTKLKEAYHKCGLDVAKTKKMNALVLPLAATYVIRQDRRIVYSFIDCDPSRRADPSEVLRAVPENWVPPEETVGMDSTSSIASILSAISTTSNSSQRQKKSKRNILTKVGRVLSGGKKQASKKKVYS